MAVPYANTSPDVQAARQRLLAPDGRMTDEERQRIQEIVMGMTPNGGGTTGNLAAEEVARAAAASAAAAAAPSA